VRVRLWCALLAAVLLAGCGATKPWAIPYKRFTAFTPVVGQVLEATTGTWGGNPTSFTYQWLDCDANGLNCVQIAGQTASHYVVQVSDEGDTIGCQVVAHNKQGSASQYCTVTGVVSGISLPSGVTLVAIDGDTLNAAGTGNATPGYYCGTAFGTTVTPANNNACLQGWDSSSFFMIADWWPTNYSSSAWATLGWNTIDRENVQADLTNALAAGQFTIDSSDSGSPNFTPNASTVGFNTYDEPNTWTQATSGMSGTANATQDGRFWYVNNTWSYMGFANVPSSVPGDNTIGTQHLEFEDTIATPNSNTRHIDLGSVDLYWFANSGADSPTIGGDVYGNGGPLSTAQTMCGCRYGDMMRPVYGTSVGMQANKYEGAWHTNNPVPMFSYVETADAFITGHLDITPPELNWAVWSSINHGARGIIYFDKATAPCNTFDYATSSCGTTIQSGNSVSIHTQLVTTDGMIQTFAPEINSPTALSYASVSPAPTTYGGIETRSVFDTNTSDCSGASSCFYVFADTRDAEVANGGPTNISATFTLAGHYSGTIPALSQCGTGSSSSYNVTDTSNQFTDTFANADCTIIYGPIPNQ
jgi:hypothetical protein